MSYSLLFEKKKKKKRKEFKTHRAAEETVSRALSVSAIRDEVKQGQMHFIHSFTKNTHSFFFIFFFMARLVTALKKIHIKFNLPFLTNCCGVMTGF